MIGILLAKIKMLIRSPWTMVVFTVMSIGFALILGSSDAYTRINVPVYSAEDTIRESVVGELLGESDVYSFQWVSEEEMLKQIANGKVEVGVKLKDTDFQLIVGVNSPNVDMIKQTIQDAYAKKQQQEEILKAINITMVEQKREILEELQSVKESPVFLIKTDSFKGSDAILYDNTFQTLFGFTLFFVIYTIAYNVLPILIEKTDGVWDRVILSPVKKWEMYVGNLLYSFVTGYLQVVIIFLVFRYIVGVDFNGNFMESLLVIIPYVFAIVALSILITSIVKTVQQFNALLPIIAVSMAMIGGAYWPIEIVESKWMLALAKVVPITYGMEVLNGVAVYGYSMSELLFPISILLLMGVVMTGIGIHLMEKRHV